MNIDKGILKTELVAELSKALIQVSKMESGENGNKEDKRKEDDVRSQQSCFIKNRRDALVIVQDEKIIFANSAIENITGYTARGVVRETFLGFCDSRQQRKHSPQIQ